MRAEKSLATNNRAEDEVAATPNIVKIVAIDKAVIDTLINILLSTPLGTKIHVVKYK